MKIAFVQTAAAVAVFALAAWVGAPGLRGAEFRSEERAQVEASEVIDDDLYIFGDEVTIDGQVNGDVIAFGRTIRVRGTIDGDLIAAGQAIVIEGNVTDDVRFAGQVLKIDKGASIGDDVIAAGFSMETVKAGSIGGDWVYAGFQALLNGDIEGSVNATMANCEIAGHVGGDLNLQVEGDPNGPKPYIAGSPPPVSVPDVPQGLTVRDTARIDGELKYKSRDEATIDEDATIAGGVEHKQPPVKQKKAEKTGLNVWPAIGQFFTLLIIGLCVVFFAPNWTSSVTNNVRSRPLASLLLGVFGMFGWLIVLLIILVAMIALAVLAGLVKLTSLVPVVIVLGISSSALIGVGFWFFTGYLAEILLAFLAGRWLLGAANPTLGENRILSLILGLVLLSALSVVPVFGTILGWLVAVMGLGALLCWLFLKQPESTQAQAPEASSKTQMA